MSEYHSTAEVGLSCVCIESCIILKLWLSIYGGRIPPRENSKCSKEARKRRRVQRGLATQKQRHQLQRRWIRRSVTVPQRWIYRSRKKGCRYKATDSRAIGLVAPYYRKGGTSMDGQKGKDSTLVIRLVFLILRGVGDKDDGEDGIIS
ncbi:hypothetical protein B296_00054458 [Ensete ventricosum]|uniref:Uncharacterized protein n=1 Tax=Ensete ventricosum TaxID=4639 RepID=A0A426X8N6_ENSVE|nr:hypothetical protein B296_00054458 [Ensete ventricosum]